MIRKEFHNQNLKFYNHLGIAEESQVIDKKVALILDEEFKDDYNAQRIFLLSANMLSRIFVNVEYIIPKGTKAHNGINEVIEQSIKEYVESMCKRIFSQGNFIYASPPKGGDNYDGILYIGNKKSVSANAMNVYSDGWNVHINKEVMLSPLHNSIGANAAACFGVSELFKVVVKPNGCRYINDMTFSLLNYNNSIPEENPRLPKKIDIRDTTLVGAGAIGSAFIYSLAGLKDVEGKLEIIDADKYSDTNLNRYIIADDMTVGLFKTEIAEKVLQVHDKLKVVKYPMVFEGYRNLQSKGIDTLITAVDKRITRFNLQTEIPRLVLDAATTDSLVDIHRVDFGAGGACLGCIYEPDEKDTSFYRYVAENLGMNLKRVEDLVNSNRGLEYEDICVISKTLGEDCSSYLGQPIDSLYSNKVCGSSKFSRNGSDLIAVAPISFISVLAGVFLAAELIKDRYFPSYKIYNSFSIDTFKIPIPELHIFKESKKNCRYCSNIEIVETYKSIWQV